MVLWRKIIQSLHLMPYGVDDTSVNYTANTAKLAD